MRTVLLFADGRRRIEPSRFDPAPQVLRVAELVSLAALPAAWQPFAATPVRTFVAERLSRHDTVWYRETL